jgi:hypothetical protein
LWEKLWEKLQRKNLEELEFPLMVRREVNVRWNERLRVQ